MRIFSVVLPRSVDPVFPDRCVVCGASGPGSSIKLVARDGRKGAALWAGWFSVRIPSCRQCGAKLHLWRLWNVLRTLMVAGAAFAFGLLVLLPRLPAWATGLIVLAICGVGFFALFVWNRFFPPPFSVDPHDHHVEYEFRDTRAGQEFAMINGVTEPM